MLLGAFSCFSSVFLRSPFSHLPSFLLVKYVSARVQGHVHLDLAALGLESRSDTFSRDGGGRGDLQRPSEERELVQVEIGRE